MVKRFLLGLGIVIVIAAGVIYAVPPFRVAFTGWLRGEAFVRGMPASYWVETLVNDPSKDARDRAAAALVELGPDVLPDLISALKAKGGHLPPQAVDVFLKLGREAAPLLVAEALGDLGEDEDFRGQATRVLLGMGQHLRGSTPALIAGLKHPEATARRGAARILTRMGREARAAAPALGEALADKVGAVRKQAAAALAALGAEARPALPCLLKALRDPTAEVRRLSAVAVGRIGARAREAVPELIALLKDREGRVREQAAKALGRVGPDAKTAVPALIFILKSDSHLDARKEAALALGRFGREARLALPELMAATFSEYQDLSVPALESLTRIGVTAPEAFPHWQASITGPGKFSSRVASRQTRVLLDRGLLPPEAVKTVLLELADHKDRTIRLRARMALVHVAPTAREAAPSYREDFFSSDQGLAAESAKRLREFGAEAMPILKELLRDESPVVRQKAVTVAGEIGGPARELVPELIARLKDLEPGVAGAADNALKRVLSLGSENLPQIKALVRGAPGKGFRYEAIYQVGNRYGPAIKDLIPDLVASLEKDPDANVRLVSAYTLQRILWLGQATIEPALLRATKDRSPAVRAQAIYFYRWFQGASKVAPDLIAHLKDDDWEVRHQAIAALAANHGIPATATKEAIPALREALGDVSAGLRRFAVYQLGKYGRLAKEAVPDLIRVAKNDPEGWSRKMAVDALANVGSSGGEEEKTVVSRLEDDADANVRTAAVWAVVRLSARDKAGTVLEAALDDSSEQVQIAASEGLTHVDPRSKKGLKTLVKVLGSKGDPYWKGMAAWTLGRMGPAARETEPALIKALDDANPNCRSQVINALANMGPPTMKSAAEVLNRLQIDNDQNVVEAAGQYVRRLGPAHQALVDKLGIGLERIHHLFGPDPLGKRPIPEASRLVPVLTAVGNIGPGAKSLLSLVVAHLKYNDPNIRSQAALAIPRINPDGKEAIPLLITFLATGDRNGILAAIQTLEQYRARAKDAAPGLKLLLNSQDFEVRQRAGRALALIESSGK